MHFFYVCNFFNVIIIQKMSRILSESILPIFNVRVTPYSRLLIEIL